MNNTPRRGTTLIELLIVMSVLAIVAAITIPASAALRDRSAVRAATTEVVSALALARSAATAEWRTVGVYFDTAAARVLVRAPPDTFADIPLGGRYGVRLSATRDSVGYGPTGRGYGASNATLTVRRGSAADTIIVSRLGRVRH